MMPLFVKSRRTGTMNPDFAISFSCALPLSHTHRMICFPIHRRSETIKAFINGNIFLFYKGLALHQPTVSSDGYTASICPGVIPCSILALILTDRVSIQPCELRCLLVSVTLLKEFQAFLSFLCRNPVTEGRCSFFHAVLLERLPVPFPRTGYFILFLRNPYLFSICCKGYRAALSNCFAVTFISYKVPYFYTLSRFKLERHLWIY